MLGAWYGKMAMKGLTGLGHLLVPEALLHRLYEPDSSGGGLGPVVQDRCDVATWCLAQAKSPSDVLDRIDHGCFRPRESAAPGWR